MLECINFVAIVVVRCDRVLIGLATATGNVPVSESGGYPVSLVTISSTMPSIYPHSPYPKGLTLTLGRGYTDEYISVP
jgi:hypothetical protein